MAYFDDVSVLYLGLIGAVAVSGLPLLVAMAIFLFSSCCGFPTGIHPGFLLVVCFSLK